VFVRLSVKLDKRAGRGKLKIEFVAWHHDMRNYKVLDFEQIVGLSFTAILNLIVLILQQQKYCFKM